MKRTKLLLMATLMAITACTSYKKVPYLQNSKEWSSMEQTIAVYEPKIQPNDLLNILITNPDNPSSSIR